MLRHFLLTAFLVVGVFGTGVARSQTSQPITDEANIFMGRQLNEIKKDGLTTHEEITALISGMQNAQGKPLNKKRFYYGLAASSRTEELSVALAMIDLGIKNPQDGYLFEAWVDFANSFGQRKYKSQNPAEINALKAITEKIVEAAMKQNLPKGMRSGLGVMMSSMKIDPRPYMDQLIVIYGEGGAGQNEIGSVFMNVLREGPPEAVAKLNAAMAEGKPQMSRFAQYAMGQNLLKDLNIIANLMLTGDAQSRLSVLQTVSSAPKIEGPLLDALIKMTEDSDIRISMQAYTTLLSLLQGETTKTGGVDLRTQPNFNAFIDRQISDPRFNGRLYAEAIQRGDRFLLTKFASKMGSPDTKLRLQAWTAIRIVPELLDAPESAEPWAAAIWDENEDIKKKATELWQEKKGNKTPLPSPPWYGKMLFWSAAPILLTVVLAAWGWWRKSKLPNVDISAAGKAAKPAAIAVKVATGLVAWQAIAIAGAIVLGFIGSPWWMMIPLMLLGAAMIIDGYAIMVWARRALSWPKLDTLMFVIITTITAIALIIDLVFRIGNLRNSAAIGALHVMIEIALIAGFLATTIWMLVVKLQDWAGMPQMNTKAAPMARSAPVTTNRGMPANVAAMPPAKRPGPPSPPTRKPPPPPR